MNPRKTGSSKRGGAEGTRAASFPTVNSLLVLGQIARQSCLIVTLVTRELDQKMNALNVLLEMMSMGKPLTALVAGEISYFEVHGLNVLLKTAFLSEFSAAGWALEILDCIVDRLHMNVNLALRAEFFLAEFTFETLPVRLLSTPVTPGTLRLFLLVLPHISTTSTMVGEHSGAGEAQAADGAQMNVPLPIFLSAESVQTLKQGEQN
jgi:hypothetical protein